MTSTRILDCHKECRRPLPPAFFLFAFLVLLPSFALGAQLAQGQGRPNRFEIAPVFSIYHAHKFATIRPDRFQLGGRFGWNWLPHLTLEAEYDSALRPEDLQSTFEGGYFSQGLFGVKSGLRWKSWEMFAKLRPGFVSFSDTVNFVNFATGKVTFGRLTDPALDAGGGAEFFLSRRWLFRYDAADLILHQGPRSFVNSAGQQVTFSPSTFNNFETEIAVAFRF